MVDKIGGRRGTFVPTDRWFQVLEGGQMETLEIGQYTVYKFAIRKHHPFIIMVSIQISEDDLQLIGSHLSVFSREI